MIIDRIAPAHAELVVQWSAGGHLGAVNRAVEGLITAGERLLAEQIDAERKPRTERVGIGKGKIEASGILAYRRRRLHDVAGPQKVCVADRNRGQNAVGGGIAARDGEIAGLLFFHHDVDDRSGIPAA